jgi:hypothetical protein
MTDTPKDGLGHHDTSPQSFSADPIQPGNGSTTELAPLSSPADRGRAGLVLFLGMLSLFMCGPIGVIAWIMANADLRRIREGKLSPRQSGTLRVGRAFGIVGTLVFVVGVVAVAVLIQRGLPTFEGWATTRPLAPEQVVFSGEWFGNRGTYIAIRANGSGDYRSRNSTVRGGRVVIDDDLLSIGIMGWAKKWHIDKRPYLEDGTWNMKLDGEIFRRKTEGLAV